MSQITLNSAQKEAVQHKKGPLLIIAGAGAGKTRTLTERIVHLIKNGINPENILAVTFTNKAAQEMRTRIDTRINTDPSLSLPISAQAGGMSMPFVATFHGLAVRLLREFYMHTKYPKNFTIADRDDSLRLI